MKEALDVLGRIADSALEDQEKTLDTVVEHAIKQAATFIDRLPITGDARGGDYFRHDTRALAEARIPVDEFNSLADQLQIFPIKEILKKAPHFGEVEKVGVEMSSSLESVNMRLRSISPDGTSENIIYAQLSKQEILIGLSAMNDDAEDFLTEEGPLTRLRAVIELMSWAETILKDKHPTLGNEPESQGATD